AALGVECVHALGITPQIGPVRFGRVDQERATPSQRLTPITDDPPYALRIGTIRIGADVFGVGFKVVALDRVRISLIRPDLADRARRWAADDPLRGSCRRRGRRA